uniref:Magnesium-dependent phosphatase-1 n=1 Tax=Homalodisca liturata TaxID=320908 RepID=A0A1B6I527_9HEMI
MLSFKSVSVVVLVTFEYLLCTVRTETFSKMTAPPKHKGVFFKKQTGLNKTIPYSENPGKEMIVFDVDGTLWPYQIDSDPIFQDPFIIKGLDNGTVFVGNQTIHIFPEVEETLLELIEKGYVLAAVSMTNSTHKTMAVLNAFDLTKHFKHMEMAPGPDKLSLVTEICTRTGLLLEDVLYFEKDPGEVFDMLWRHVIVYCIDENGLTKDRARKGLFIFDIRPRKERRQHLNNAKREFTDKNKSRPAKERDGTELEGMIHNGSAIDYQ